MNKLGKYELIQELGRGAMGIVYRARDPIINRLVALKTITKGVAEDPNMLQRFYREAQSAGGLQHPNIVTIYDMGEEAGTPYIAMELVEGESLEQLIGNRPDLPLSLKLTYAIQACRAFDYAHKRGIIHRDIKPANVMLSKEGIVKVVDFGIARVVKTSKTQTGMLIGTFAYMAPEQYHGEHADERSDLWSFGVLLYELISYQRPFRGDAPAILMHGICDQDFEPLCAAFPESPPELGAVLSRVLQKSPMDRYQSMEDLLLELDPICKGLQSATVAKLVEHGHELVRQGDYPQARDILRQALQVESTNTQARSLLDKVNTELRRILIRPKAQEIVERGRALLEQGRIQEARAESENALRLDPSFEPAQELQQLIQRESDRSQLVSQYLEAFQTSASRGLTRGGRGSSRQSCGDRTLQQVSHGLAATGSKGKSATRPSHSFSGHDAAGTQSVDAAKIFGLHSTSERIAGRVSGRGRNPPAARDRARRAGRTGAAAKPGKGTKPAGGWPASGIRGFAP